MKHESQDSPVKQQVRQFYDQVGWKMESDGFYQNARYEDLRPVSQTYIHRCHLRVNRYLTKTGQLLLDAGSGPVQYPEYLTYSEGYQHRVCADISILALQEARKRLGEHGLFVVADVANLPFRDDAFGGIVSLHTLHHLPLQEQVKAYHELHRTLEPGKTTVIVNGWTDSDLMKNSAWLVALMERIGRLILRLRDGKSHEQRTKAGKQKEDPKSSAQKPTGTYVEKLNADWLKSEIGSHINLEIFVWRSVNVRFLRAVIHRQFLGKLWLGLLYWLEGKFPKYFGEKGQYPLVVLKKAKVDDGDSKQ